MNYYGVGNLNTFWIRQRGWRWHLKFGGYDEMKMFKIVKLNLCDKTKDWFKKLQHVLVDWNEMKTSMHQKLVL